MKLVSKLALCGISVFLAAGCSKKSDKKKNPPATQVQKLPDDFSAQNTVITERLESNWKAIAPQAEKSLTQLRGTQAWNRAQTLDGETWSEGPVNSLPGNAPLRLVSKRFSKALTDAVPQSDEGTISDVMGPIIDHVLTEEKAIGVHDGYFLYSLDALKETCEGDKACEKLFDEHSFAAKLSGEAGVNLAVFDAGNTSIAKFDIAPNALAFELNLAGLNKITALADKPEADETTLDSFSGNARLELSFTADRALASFSLPQGLTVSATEREEGKASKFQYILAAASPLFKIDQDLASQKVEVSLNLARAELKGSDVQLIFPGLTAVMKSDETSISSTFTIPAGQAQAIAHDLETKKTDTLSWTTDRVWTISTSENEALEGKTQFSPIQLTLAANGQTFGVLSSTEGMETSHKGETIKVTKGQVSLKAQGSEIFNMKSGLCYTLPEESAEWEDEDDMTSAFPQPTTCPASF